jgi:predicted glycosyltransferase
VKIWFDADNGPHVLILKPLARELQRRGHEVVFTARDRTRTCELLDLYGLPYRKVGGVYGKGMWNKVRGTLGRAAHLAAVMRGQGCDVSFGHGSRALPPASRLLGVPTLTMYDYEWVDPRLFNTCCRAILLPDAIDAGRCREAGVADAKVVRFPGLKEELYLADAPLDPQAVARDLELRLDAVKVLLRPPATDAHYHNPEAEAVLEAILERLAGRDDLDLVYLARSADQQAFLAGHDLARTIVPQRVYDGPSLVAAMDLVIGGGGTMTREAAVLGVPACSFFRGRLGRVDETLEQEGRLLMLRRPEEAATLPLIPRTEPAVAPDNAPLVAWICDRIERAATAATPPAAPQA